MDAIEFRIAETSADLAFAKKLFIEYAGSLNFDLGYQDFENELATLHEQYQKPAGVLILCFYNGIAIGCVGVRRFSATVAELKRLFVKPEFRNLRAGRQLLEHAIQQAKQLNYHYIRLDTVPGQEKAQTLYRQLGFYEIPSYRHSPINGTIFMEKNLSHA